MPAASSSLISLSQFSASAQLVCPSGSTAAEPLPHAAVYKVDIITGTVRGAGTHAPAVVQLVGAEGVSAEYVLGNDQDEYGFERGSRKVYELDIGTELGTLQRVKVQQVPASVAELGSDWYLDRIEVTGPEGVCWRFPCDAWFGRTEGDDYTGVMERTLTASEVQPVAAPRRLATPLAVSASAVALPHPEKVGAGHPKAVNRKAEGWGGEDAYFCSTAEDGTFALGVADGVYMWKQQGIDSGLFSRSLMAYARQAVLEGERDPVKVLRKAEDGNERDGLKGSSTACVVLIDTAQGQLKSANVGDSGFLIVKRGGSGEQLSVKYHSPQQEHSFGCPYQLGHYEGADSPEDAMLMTVPVEAGDFVVLGSDGLWDNLSDEQILEEVRASLHAREGASAAAHRLAAAAFRHSLDRHSQTPYSLGASEAFDMVYSGGKMDDITVVVALLR
ncbi:Protein phosphatase PTC7 homolog fig at C-terminar half [Coccomyxa sp. Obi]|nr:Protein phosphatase PTC7 homolog fig at C-terminar half [Coccomyxa sp. Obi]